MARWTYFTTKSGKRYKRKGSIIKKVTSNRAVEKSTRIKQARQTERKAAAILGSATPTWYPDRVKKPQ